MGRSVGQLAGIVAFSLVLGRLGRLLQTGPGIPNWQLILLASAFLGGLVWWLLRQTVTNRTLTLTVFGLGAVILFLTIAVPETLVARVLPTRTTWPELIDSLQQAIAQIRHGVPPIIPSEGVIAILAIVMWTVGALYVWGMTGGPAGAMVIPSIVLYLQFAIFDRRGAGLGWMMASSLMLAMALAALALEARRDIGRARDTEGRPKPVRSMGSALVMALVVGLVAISAANSASGVVSEYGNVPWRSSSGGYGGGGSGDFALQRFVTLQQRLINRSDVPLFQVTVDERAPQLDQLYFRVEALDSFDGSAWRRSGGDDRFYEPDQPVGDPANIYQGSTQVFTQRIRIDGLTNEVLPTAGTPLDIHAVSGDDAIDPREFTVLGDDTALFYPPRSREGQVYQVEASYPLTASDLGALATTSDGTLSSLFAAAAEDNLFNATPKMLDVVATPPADLDFYREQDDDVAPGISSLARQVTRGAETDFERAWMLQHFFRDSTDEDDNPTFIYDDQVSTGVSALDLEEWLTEPTSLNYRRGYCSQFATSMAVMAREIGLASRVVLGFTPGAVGTTTSGDRFVEVRDTNAHAWVEIWIDPVGWVQFDPTPRRAAEPTINQPESLTAVFNPADYIEDTPGASDLTPPGGAADPTLLETLGDPVVDETSPDGTTWWWLALLTAPLLLVIPPIAKRIRRRRRLVAIREGDITAAWDELVDRLEDLGDPVPQTKTPVEFAMDTDTALLPIAVSYSSTVYGARDGQAVESDLYTVEGWMLDHYASVDRFRAAMNPRSLIRRGN